MDKIIEEYEKLKKQPKEEKQYPTFIIEKEINISKIQLRISELKKLLCATDYQAIKYAENEISIEEYLPIKNKRASYRAEINSLEEKLKNLA